VISVESNLRWRMNTYYTVRGQLFICQRAVYFWWFSSAIRFHLHHHVYVRHGSGIRNFGHTRLDQVHRKTRQAGSQREVFESQRESLKSFERISESPAVVIGASCDLS